MEVCQNLVVICHLRTLTQKMNYFSHFRLLNKCIRGYLMRSKSITHLTYQSVNSQKDQNFQKIQRKEASNKHSTMRMLQSKKFAVWKQTGYINKLLRMKDKNVNKCQMWQPRHSRSKRLKEKFSQKSMKEDRDRDKFGWIENKRSKFNQMIINSLTCYLQRVMLCTGKTSHSKNNRLNQQSLKTLFTGRERVKIIHYLGDLA